jgi:competence protein ComEA
MFATRALRLGTVVTLAVAASFGSPAPARAQATKTETKAKVTKDQAKDKAKAKAAALVDLNSATSEELQTLPGVGEVTARKIIDGRPHKAVTDLAGAGVSASEIEKLKPLVEAKPLPSPVDVNLDPLEKIETLPGISATLAKEIVATRPHAGYDSIAKVKGIGPVKLEALKGRLKFGEEPAIAKAKAKAEVKVAEAKVEEAAAKAKVAEAKEGMPKAKAKLDEAKAKVKGAEAKAEEKVAPKIVEAKEKGKDAMKKVGDKVVDVKAKAKAKLAPGTKVNINTADKDVLDELPGIGPVKAQAILDYRAEKKFEKIEDIMQVKGIKEGEFGKIKDIIVVK